MLGRFLELGVAAKEIGESYEFFQTIGFQNVPTGDIVDHPYAVLDGSGLCIGLHAHAEIEPRLVFVRSELESYARALRRLKIKFEYSRLASDEFNVLGFCDPDGQLVELIEAQTFSPGARPETRNSVCGDFLEYSMMASSLPQSVAFWQALGFETVASGESPHPWQRLTGFGLTLGLHESAYFAPGPSFSATDLGTRLEFLDAKGIDVRDRRRDTGAFGARAKLVSPDGLPIYLFQLLE